MYSSADVSRTVLDDVSLCAEEGDIIDIVGPSGAGKSTLMLTLAQLLPGARAQLLLDGISSSQYSPEKWRSLVTLLPQKPQLIGDTVEDALLLPWTLKLYATREKPPQTTLRDRLDALGLSDVALDRLSDQLSVGQQARIAFLRSVLIDPRVLLLDEADAALDEESSHYITALTREFAAAPGHAVIRVRHRASDHIATRRFRLKAGALTREAAR